MFTRESKRVVFHESLRPSGRSFDAPEAALGLQLCRHAGKPTYYSILSQSREDLRDPENSPSISMWPYLLASSQTERLNQISVYTERGTTVEKIRFLYLNDAALALWAEMHHTTQVMGRLYRPPRSAVLSFGMPFSE